MPIRVTVWGEFRHEKRSEEVHKLYPHGMHEAIASFLRKNKDLKVRTATLDQPDNGLTDAVLADTDVLTWWGHLAHSDVQDLICERVVRRVQKGMGFIVLHSGHFSKPFRRLMGTSCDLKWRLGEHKEIVWITKPGHPIAAGLADHFIIPREEMYGEHFDIPEPMETVFISTFTPGGECCRSGVTYTRGAGKIFYFRPGHETYPTYYDPNVQRVITNAVRWAAPTPNSHEQTYGNRLEGWLDQPQPTNNQSRKFPKPTSRKSTTKSK